MTDKKTIGSFEIVTFPDYAAIGTMQAKIDTGAYTGALHCTKIHEQQSGIGKVLRFSPFDHPEVEIMTKDYRTDKVKSSNGVRQKRYFIKTRITIQDKVYDITLSLADRSDMKWPVLIGRRFLRKYNFLVDVNKVNP